MPFLKKQKPFTPFRLDVDKRSRKNGLRAAVFNLHKDKYVGEWCNDFSTGKGMLLTPDGLLYEGDWRNGFWHGFGILSHRRLDKTYEIEYSGEWFQGKNHGIGWKLYVNGNIYFGFQKTGKKHGYGKMYYQDGTYYAGHWANNLKEGLGMMVLENNNRYEGYWKDGARNGKGRFYHLRTGQMQEGIWLNNVCINSYLKDIPYRQSALQPTHYPIPPHELADLQNVLLKEEKYIMSYLIEVDKELVKCIELLDFLNN